MERTKLTVPVRRLEHSACRLVDGYDVEKVERIKIRDNVSQFSHVKELASIDDDLRSMVRKIKTRRNLGLVYQVVILKVYLGRFLAKVRSLRKARILSSHMAERHSHRKADLHLCLVENQNSASKSSNRMDLRMLPRVFKNQYFRKGGSVDLRNTPPSEHSMSSFVGLLRREREQEDAVRTEPRIPSCLASMASGDGSWRCMAGGVGRRRKLARTITHGPSVFAKRNAYKPNSRPTSVVGRRNKLLVESRLLNIHEIRRKNEQSIRRSLHIKQKGEFLRSIHAIGRIELATRGERLLREVVVREMRKVGKASAALESKLQRFTQIRSLLAADVEARRSGFMKSAQKFIKEVMEKLRQKGIKILSIDLVTEKGGLERGVVIDVEKKEVLVKSLGAVRHMIKKQSYFGVAGRLFGRKDLLSLRLGSESVAVGSLVEAKGRIQEKKPADIVTLDENKGKSGPAPRMDVRAKSPALVELSSHLISRSKESGQSGRGSFLAGGTMLAKFGDLISKPGGAVPAKQEISGKKEIPIGKPAVKAVPKDQSELLCKKGEESLLETKKSPPAKETGGIPGSDVLPGQAPSLKKGLSTKDFPKVAVTKPGVLKKSSIVCKKVPPKQQGPTEPMTDKSSGASGKEDQETKQACNPDKIWSARLQDLYKRMRAEGSQTDGVSARCLRREKKRLGVGGGTKEERRVRIYTRLGLIGRAGSGGRRHTRLSGKPGALKRYGMPALMSYTCRGYSQALGSASEQTYWQEKLSLGYSDKSHIQYILENPSSYVYGIHRHHELLSIARNTMNEDVQFYRMNKLTKYALTTKVSRIEQFVEEVMGEMIINGDLKEARENVLENNIMRLRYLVNADKEEKSSLSRCTRQKSSEASQLWEKLISRFELGGNHSSLSSPSSSSSLWLEASEFIYNEEVDFFKKVYYLSDPDDLENAHLDESVLQSTLRSIRVPNTSREFRPPCILSLAIRGGSGNPSSLLYRRDFISYVGKLSPWTKLALTQKTRSWHHKSQSIKTD